MSKLLPSWCLSPQPSATYYFQKLSCDILGIVYHRDGSGAAYIFDERLGPKNTDHTISYILHYIKCDKEPSWVKRIHLFMDNAGSTNKNQYTMGAAMEIVQENLLDFFRLSFMVAGHTKFDPNRLFSCIARPFNHADTFNITQLAELISQYASVTVDDGKIVRAWRSLLPNKYTNLPGIRNLRDFLIVKNPTNGCSPMKVRNFGYEGSFQNSPMRKNSDDCVLPTPCHSYKYLNKVRELSDAKTKDLRHMSNLYISPDMLPDFLS